MRLFQISTVLLVFLGFATFSNSTVLAQNLGRSFYEAVLAAVTATNLYKREVAAGYLE